MDSRRRKYLREEEIKEDLNALDSFLVEDLELNLKDALHLLREYQTQLEDKLQSETEGEIVGENPSYIS